MRKILFATAITLLIFSAVIKAQDVQLVVPKSSIENSIKTLLDARAASFSSYTQGFGVDMYNVKLVYSQSHPLTFTLIPPNRFSLTCGIMGRANIDYILDEFEINLEGDITLEGLITAEGSQGQIKLRGSADAVIQASGFEGFLLELIYTNELILKLPPFDLATFVYTLPSIPLDYFTTNYPTINITSNNVVLGLQTPNSFLVVDQRAEDGNRIIGSQVAHWNGSTFINYTAPKVFSNLPVSTNQTFRGSQQLLESPLQKYNSWNKSDNILNHQTFFLDGTVSRLNSDFKKSYSGIVVKTNLEGGSASGGTIGFQDPWFVDYADPSYGNSLRNRGTSAVFRTRTSPFSPDYSTTYENDQPYLGVFLDQGYDGQNWDEPYYKVKAQPQTIEVNGSDHQIYFQNWEATNATLQFANQEETGVAFHTANAVVKANYKCSQLTSDNLALHSSSQKKLVRSGNGKLHLVYESMDRVWYEMSTDNGSTWTIMNGGKPLSSGESKNPSILETAPYCYITFQENINGYSIVKVQMLNFMTDQVVDEEIFDIATNSYSFDANPVVLTSQFDAQASVILLLYRKYSVHTFDPGEGYLLSIGKLNNANDLGFDQFDLPYQVQVPNTDENSNNIAIANDWWYNHYNGNIFHLVWEQKTSTASTVLKYTQLIFNYSNNGVSYNPANPDEPSLGCGYTKNYSPSIVVLDDGLPRLTWVGERDMEQEENTAKVNGIEAGTIQKRVILRGRNTQGDWNPTIFTYGSNVNKVSMSYNETGTIGGYAFAWTENESVPYNYKHVKNTTLNYSPMPLYSVEGKYLQLCNGDDFSDMYAMGLTETLPYAYNLSENLSYTGGQQEAKVNSGNFASIGREGIITNGDAEFYFTIKDVLVENTEISFSEVNENTTYSNLSEFNSYLSTEPFELNNNSSFLYTVQYGLIERDSIISPLGEGKFINFKVQLIDAVSNDLIGEFDNVTYTDDDIYQYANIGYQVNTEGIGERTVKLKLVVDYNIAPVYSLSTLYTEENLLAKRGLHQIGFEGSLEVKEYHLAQNYPNPFNPATTINYQIPQDGAVKLVIYDALGREVRTLVNEYKTKGRYEAVFNANDLASGVYIYHLKVNDFVQTRKMMLLK